MKFLNDFTDGNKYIKTKGIALLVLWLLVGMVEKI